MKYTFLCTIICLSIPSVLRCGELESLLKTLDRLVDNKEYYADIREKKIDSLKFELYKADNLMDKIRLTNNLDLQYIVYQTDSALVYAKSMMKYAIQSGSRSKTVEAAVNIARVLDAMGQYKEALEVLNNVADNVPEQEKAQFAYCRLTIYNSLRDYSIDTNSKMKYAALADIYRDSIITCYSLINNNQLFVKTEKLIMEGRFEEARDSLEKVYYKLSPRQRDAGIMAYSLGNIYKGLGDRDSAALFFARSAISDLYSGVKQHKSLKTLSEILYEAGDIDRAYKYAKSSMEDYIFCNARLRTLEASDIFVLIDHAYQTKKDQTSDIMLVFLVVSSALSLTLMIAIFYIRRINQRLSRANLEISAISGKLQDANKIKEEYIGLYMEHCSDYLDKMNSTWNKINKSIRRGVESKQLLEEIKATMNLSGEINDFYHTFDVTILHLSPDFPQKMDELLVPEARGLYSKAKNGLSPEYRIFALIRLGITDSTKIAKFLRYSLSTIYNYRTKLRNKSQGRREDFEKEVMRIDRNTINY